MKASPVTIAGRASALVIVTLLLLGGRAAPAAELRWVDGHATLRDCPTCPEMIVVPAGRYTMGTPPGAAIDAEVPAEREPVQIEIPRPFALGRYEVTYQEYAARVTASAASGCRSWDVDKDGFRDDPRLDWRRPRMDRSPGPRDPVTCVSWGDAHDYAAALARTTHRNYRLPSEAEWEYAARAGSGALRPWGDSPDEACAWANTYDETSAATYVLGWARHACRDGHAALAPVGSMRPNAFGLYDMIGNVWEWLEDCSTLTYVGRPRDARPWVWPGGCTRRIQRGGGWSTGPDRSRSGFHGDGAVEDRADFAGLRVARDLGDDEIAAFQRVSCGSGCSAPGAREQARPVHVTRSASAANPGAPGPRPASAASDDLPGGYARLAPGRYVMGSSADAYEHDTPSGETPPLAVSITRPFAIGLREVTIAEYRRFVEASGHRAVAGCRVLVDGAWRWSSTADWQHPRDGVVDEREPVACVDVADVEAYAAWLGARDGRHYRLPSESEWEYAARAGTVTPRPWGTARDSHEGVSISLACDHANVHDVAAARSQVLPWPNARCRDGFVAAAPVGSFAPNGFGLFDMVGNVREWTADCFTTSYKGRPATEAAWRWDGGCEQRPVRGGSWASRPIDSRSASRIGEAASARQSDLGFRLVVEPW